MKIMYWLGFILLIQCLFFIIYTHPGLPPSSRVTFHFASVSPALRRDIADRLEPGSAGTPASSGLHPSTKVVEILPALPLYHFAYDEVVTATGLNERKTSTMYFPFKYNGIIVAAEQVQVGANGRAISYDQIDGYLSYMGSINAVTTAIEAAAANQDIPAGTYEPRLIVTPRYDALWLKSFSGQDYFYMINFDYIGDVALKLCTVAQFVAASNAKYAETANYDHPKTATLPLSFPGLWTPNTGAKKSPTPALLPTSATNPPVQ